MQVEEPEDGYIPNPEDGEGNKRSASTDTKENSSPKKKRTKTTDIALENAPSDEVRLLINDIYKGLERRILNPVFSHIRIELIFLSLALCNYLKVLIY